MKDEKAEPGLMDYLAVLVRRRFLIACFAAVGVTLALVISLALPRVYRVRALLWVENPWSLVKSDQVLAKTLADLQAHGETRFGEWTPTRGGAAAIDRLSRHIEILRSRYLMRISVKADRPELSFDICRIFIDRLLDHEKAQIERSRRILDKKMAVTGSVSAMVERVMTRTRARLDGLREKDPESEEKGNHLRDLVSRLEMKRVKLAERRSRIVLQKLKLENSYALVAPRRPEGPHSPRLVLNLLAGLFLSLYAGLFAAFLLEALAKRRTNAAGSDRDR